MMIDDGMMADDGESSVVSRQWAIPDSPKVLHEGTHERMIEPYVYGARACGSDDSQTV